MARRRMVTRTIVSTILGVTFADLTDNTVKQAAYTIPTEIKDPDEALKKVKKAWGTEATTKIPLNCIIIGTEEKLYGMPEELFMKYAEEMPERQ